MLRALPQDKVYVRVIEESIGEIGERDVKLAQSANAKIIGFRTKADAIVAPGIQRGEISAAIFDVIYDLIQHIRELMDQMEKVAIPVRKDCGTLKVLAVFLTEKNRQIVGGKVIDGAAKKGADIEVFRGDVLIARGKVVNLQKNKKDALEVTKGEECGILYEGTEKVQPEDSLLFYTE